MPSSDKQDSQNSKHKAKKPVNEEGCQRDLNVHPEFDAFQKCVGNQSVTTFTGFIGAIDESRVELYPNFDLTFFHVIPRADIRFVKKVSNDPEGRVTLYVRDTADAKSCAVRQTSLGITAMTPTCESVKNLQCVGYTIGYPPFEVFEVNGRYYAKVTQGGGDNVCFLYPVSNFIRKP